MRDTFKVNEQEYAALSILKKIHQKMKNKENLTDEEYNFVLGSEASVFKSAKLREQTLNKENIEYQRKAQLRRNKTQIIQLIREKEFKELEVNEKKLLEVHEGFVDKVKPAYFLLGEIDAIKVKIVELEEQNKNIEEEMEKSG